MNSKLISLFVFLGIFLFTSCDDDNKGIKAPINIPTPIKNVEIPFASAKDLKIPVIPPIYLDFDADKYIRENAAPASLDNVKSAKLKSFTIELEDSSFIGDLSAIKDAEIYLKSENPAQEELKVAWVKDNTNDKKLEFEVDSSKDLLPYFKAEKQYIVVRNIVGAKGSLTTFTVKLIPEWEMSFGL